MTIDTWVVLIIFLLSNFTALYMCFSEDKLSKKLDKSVEEMDKLKTENASLKEELRRQEVMSLLSKCTLGGTKNERHFYISNS